MLIRPDDLSSFS